MVVCASVPHHITAAFVPSWSDSPGSTGSIGVGIAVEPRLELCVGVRLSSRPALTAEKLLASEGLANLNDVTASNPLPWGFGYAVSGASAVAAAHLISALKGVPIMAELRKAHEVEVLDRTGLGDVLAISCGIGLVLRKSPGPPGVGSVDCIYMPRSLALLSVELGSMSTKDLLSQVSDEFYSESGTLIRRLEESMDIDTFLEGVRLMNDRLRAPQRLLGSRFDSFRSTPGLVSYYVKKCMIVLIVEADALYDAASYINKLGLPVRKLSASESPPFLR